MSENTFICAHCGQSYPTQEGHMVGNDQLCHNCMESETVQCIHCGAHVYNDLNSGTDDIPLCASCYNRYEYAFCEHCGVLLRGGDVFYAGEDDIPYCRDCYERYRGSEVIHAYHYKPDPIFYGEGPRYFGVELEIDGAGERNDYAKEVLAAGNLEGKEHIYAKRDGSLDDGFEIVSEPMSLEYHCNEMPWDKVLEKARQLGYKSHSASTCGLHTHVSRLTFGETEDQQDRCIARLLYLVEAFYNEILKFSRRTERQMERWAARYGYRERPVEILEHAKKGGSNGRYSAINLENSSTIEFRMFRGTLKLNTFIATLQFVNILCNVALSLSDDEIKALSWSSFVSGITEQEYPELVLYLKERRLYTNDIVEESEVEV